jgi:hypothetical protein
MIGVGLAMFFSGGSIFSPGGVSTFAARGKVLRGFHSHAEFENDCLQCHAPLLGVTSARCEACHDSVQSQAAAQTGIHGKLAAADLARCANCHGEHHGADFNPNQLAVKKFDHASIGFSLDHHLINFDKTSAIQCLDCHADDQAYTLKAAACTDCHTAHDPEPMTQHIQAFGGDCAKCHDGLDKTRFDHAQTRFPLTGKHGAGTAGQGVPCVKCHSADVPPQNAPTRCQDCHAEPAVHAGLLGSDCAACHTPAGWKPARVAGRPAFDHEQIAFKLVSHAHNYDGSTMNCRACHTSAGDFTVAARVCVDCHGGHDAAFMSKHVAQYGAVCADCHDGTAGLKNFDHSKFFVLDGKHAPLDCKACHANKQFKGTPRECSGCHQEPAIHAGVFGLKCGDCHTSTAWSPAQLTRHAFPLDHGERGQVPCANCHPAKYTTYTCYGCHEHDLAVVQEQHQEVNLGGRRLEDCAACHPDGHKTEGGG